VPQEFGGLSIWWVRVDRLVMPGMGGHASAMEVGQPPSPPPMLYISAYEKPQGEMAKRFLQKPFSISDLTQAVRQLLPQEAGSKT